MVQLTVSLPDDLRRYVDARAASEGFADPADFLRDLIERDLSTGSDIRHVRALWDEGVRSSIIDDEPEDVLEQIIAEIPARDETA